jgi:uncharacterized protein YqhQ
MKDGLLNVGGQAVIEGVMMRSPNSFVVAVRRAAGEIVIKESRWNSISNSLPFLKWPFLRGTVVLIEALINGISALNFSANQAMEDLEAEERRQKMADQAESVDAEEKAPEPETMSSWAMFSLIASSFALGILFFVVIPHFLTNLLGRFFSHGLTVESGLFHLIDGIIKVIFFVGYIWVISLWEDIRRVFEYHGAEHKAIYAYEHGESLTLANAKKYPTLHPRCGTSFLISVILISIILFTAVFPLLPDFKNIPTILRHLLFIFIKIPLLLPIAGIAYELIKYAGKNAERSWVKIMIWPGLMLQKITTREPSDAQLEIGLVALKKSLMLEHEGRLAQEGIIAYKEAGLILEEN